MFIGTHALSPVVVVAACEVVRRESGRMPRWTGRHFLGIALAGAAPDLLWPHLSLAARLSSWSHTLWFVPLFYFVARRMAPRYYESEASALVPICTMAVVWHLFCDAIAGGIAPFWPISSQTFGVRWVPYSLWGWSDLTFILLSVFLFGWLSFRSKT